MTRTITLLAALLIPTVVFAIIPPAFNNVMPEHLRAQADAIRKEYAQGYWFKRTEERRLLRERQAMGEQLTSAALNPDSAYVPIIIGRYSNSHESYSPQAFQQLLFDGPNASGTVTQFYLENSYGQLYFTGKAEGWFAAPRDFNYYVHDGGTRNAGLVYGGKDFVIDVLVAADSVVDFSRYVKYYDAQGRGHVPQLGVVHTGGDAAGGADNIWSHRSNIRTRLRERKNAGSETIFDVSRVTPEGWYTTNDFTTTGTAVLIDGDYAIQPEMSGNTNTGGSLIQIGVFAHEFGHVFGLPDLYDRDGSSEGLGGWCLMASGSYGGDQRHSNYPANFSAWCKERLGWVTPIVVTSYLKQQPIRNSEDFPEIYKLWKLGAPGSEYFLVENRQNVKSDTYLLNSGILIFHVDNTVTTQNDNENHNLVDLEQADGNRNLNSTANRGDIGDPFPGSTNNRKFDGGTNPNSNDYTSSATYVGVRNISTSSMTMTADLDVGTRPIIVAKSLAAIKGAGRVEPGQDGDLRIQLANTNPTDATNFLLSVRSTAQGATADTSVTLSVSGLNEKTVTLERFLHVASSFVPREVSFDIVAITPQDTFRYVTPVLIGYPAILIVDRDSTNENVAQYYRSAIDGNGGYYESFPTQGNSFSAAAFGRRKIIIWCTGRKLSETIPDSAQQALTSFAGSGGHLFISGQNIAENLTALNSPFLQQVLHAQWSKNVLLGKTVYGITTDMLGAQIPKLTLAGGNGASNQTSLDELTADSLAHKALLYNNAAGTSLAGIWYESPVSRGKVVFFGFGFEGSNDFASTATRQQVMGAILNWFNGTTSVPGDELAGTMPNAFLISQNFPNPFNPATEIQYELARESHVTLSIYNSIGQELTRLVDQIQGPGNHRVRWNGTNSAGVQLASGVYFYRLEATAQSANVPGNHFISTKKMLMLK